MGRNILLRKSGTKRLRRILSDLKKYGKTSMCPHWNNHIRKVEMKRFESKDSFDSRLTLELFVYKYYQHCFVCKDLFPKVIKNMECPCFTYKPKYLIRRLSEIIKFNE